jgi:hypothetical protein
LSFAGCHRAYQAGYGVYERTEVKYVSGGCSSAPNIEHLSMPERRYAERQSSSLYFRRAIVKYLPCPYGAFIPLLESFHFLINTMKTIFINHVHSIHTVLDCYSTYSRIPLFGLLAESIRVQEALESLAFKKRLLSLPPF